MSAPLVLTLPKYIGSTNAGCPMIFEESMDSEKSSRRGKKRRLDHLTWEEKLLRKKLKNRVAAQTSRDRKKAKMDEMEQSLQMLSDQNQLLVEECKHLRKMNEKLTSENEELRKRLQSQDMPVGCNPSQGPAASAENPLQKGTSRGMQPVAVLLLNHLLKLVLTSYLLCPTSSANSKTKTLTLTSSKHLHKIFSRISLATWKQIIKKEIKESSTDSKKSADATGLVGSSSEDLESSRSKLLTDTDVIAPFPVVTNTNAQPNHKAVESTSDLEKSQCTEAITQSEDGVETLYGTYDEASNCIIIISDSDEDVCLGEAVTEVITSTESEFEEEEIGALNTQQNTSFLDTKNKGSEKLPVDYLTFDKQMDFLTSPASSRDSLSPSPVYNKHEDVTKLCESGYESIDSPHSDSSGNEYSELWNDTFSELFPTLL